MSVTKGNVESKRRDGKGIKLQDGEWYSAFSETTLSEVNRGDLVEFEYVTKGDWKNIKGNVTVLSASPKAGGGGPAPKAYRPFPVPKDHGDRAIIRQNVLGHATNIVNGYCSQGPGGDEDFSLEYRLQAVIQVARDLEKYATGELDAEALAKLTEE